MSDFVFLFRTNSVDRQAAMGTPEQAQRSMQKWMEWIRDLETNGHLKNRGQPLDVSGSSVVRGPKPVITDGPYVEAKDMVLGFIVVSARDLAEAQELAKGCPMLAGAGSVEIRPVMQAPVLQTA